MTEETCTFELTLKQYANLLHILGYYEKVTKMDGREKQAAKANELFNELQNQQ